MFKKMVFRFVLKQVEKADDIQITEVIQAVIKRYGKVFPDWEVMFLSLPKDPQARREQMEGVRQYLNSTANPDRVEL